MAGSSDKRRSLFGRRAESHGSFAMIQPQLTTMVGHPLRQIGTDSPDRGSLMDDAKQREAYSLAKEVGEIGYVMNKSADTMAQGKLIVEEYKGGRWVTTQDERAQRVMAAFVDPRGSQDDLLRRSGLNTGIGGEFYLLGTPGKNPSGVDTGLVWEILSPRELSITYGSEAVKRRRDGLGFEDLDGKSLYMARGWRSDPEFSLMSDSSLLRALPIAREVLLLTRLVDAVISSRLNAGLFYIPHEVSFAKEDHEDTDGDPDSYGEEDDPNAGIDAFSRLFIQQVTAPVTDRGNQASLVPLLMRGPALIGDKPVKDLLGLIDLERDLDEWAMKLRQEALHRLAASLDVPIEAMEGTTGLSHWSVFGVESDLITRHVAPKGYLFADFVTVAYLRPMLEVYEGASAAVSAKFRVRYDVAALKSAMDEANFTRFAYDRGEAGAEALLRSHGLESTDAPTDAERKDRWITEMVKAVPVLAPALLPQHSLAAGVDLSALLVLDRPGRDILDEGTGPTGRKTDPASRRSLGPETTRRSGSNLPDDDSSQDRSGSGGEARGGRDMPDARGPGRASTDMAMLVERISVAADSAIGRAYERAGSRLKGTAVNKKDPTLRDRLAKADPMRAMTLVSPAELTGVGLSAEVLLEGAWDDFSLRARSWVRSYLENQGVESLLAEDKAAFAISQLCEGLQAFAAISLHRGLTVGPDGLRLPPALVEVSLSTAMPVMI